MFGVLQGLLTSSEIATSKSEKISFMAPILVIGSRTLTVANGDLFMQLTNVSHVKKGLVDTVTTIPIVETFIAIIASVLVIAALVNAGLNWVALGASVFAIVATVAVFLLRIRQTNHYGLLVALNSKVVCTFISTNNQVVADAYDFLRSVIGTGAQVEPVTFNFGSGGAAGGGYAYRAGPSDGDYSNSNLNSNYANDGYAHANAHATGYAQRSSAYDEYEPATAPPSKPDFDPRQFVDELLRTIDEIHYSKELGDQQKSLLIDIMMEAKTGVEYNYQQEMDQSRVRFRDFAYKTKDTWPSLMSSLSARPNLVTFFSSY